MEESAVEQPATKIIWLDEKQKIASLHEVPGWQEIVLPFPEHYQNCVDGLVRAGYLFQ